MKRDKLKVYIAPTPDGTGLADYCLKSEVEAAIAELKDKCRMHDFFWEGCGFAKRGFKNTIAVSETFDRLEAENAELKKKLESVQASMYADVVDANMDNRRLRRALWIARAERAEAEHAHWATIWFCNTKIVLNINKSSVSKYPYKSNTFRNAAEWRNMWYDIASKCRAKAEQYK